MAVKGTRANELQVAFRHFGYEMTLLADLRCNAPTLAAWERERTNLDAAYVVMVTGHWGSSSGEPMVKRPHPGTTTIRATRAVLLLDGTGEAAAMALGSAFAHMAGSAEKRVVLVVAINSYESLPRDLGKLECPRRLTNSN